MPAARRLVRASLVELGAGAAEGAFIGTERLVDLLERQESRKQNPPETLRHLVLAVLEHQEEMLKDDATLLLLEWAGDSAALIRGRARHKIEKGRRLDAG